MRVSDRDEVRMKALLAEINVACNAALDGGLSLSRISFVLACQIKSCSKLANHGTVHVEAVVKSFRDLMESK